MEKNIIIVEENLQNVKYIINNIVNTIENQNIRTFVATNRNEIQEIEKLTNISLFLVNKKLKNKMENSYPVFCYRRGY